MAYDWQDPKIGDIVYEAYTPMKAGKIVKVEVTKKATGVPGTPGYWPEEVRETVQKLDGTTFSSIALKCYETLVEDHSRKARNQGAILAKLRKI